MPSWEKLFLQTLVYNPTQLRRQKLFFKHLLKVFKRKCSEEFMSLFLFKLSHCKSMTFIESVVLFTFLFTRGIKILLNVELFPTVFHHWRNRKHPPRASSFKFLIGKRMYVETLDVSFIFPLQHIIVTGVWRIRGRTRPRTELPKCWSRRRIASADYTLSPT